MKRFPVLILILISLAMPAAAKPAVGYSIAPVGEMGANGSFGALNLAFMVSMESSVHAGDIELSVDLSPYGKVFQGADLRISTPLFAVTDHPFNVLFPIAALIPPIKNFHKVFLRIDKAYGIKRFGKVSREQVFVWQYEGLRKLLAEAGAKTE